jgi:hypothetical protein
VISLDQALLNEARRLITGANVHRVKEQIFAYEQAVMLHNKGWAMHKIQSYDPTAEIELRRHVLKGKMQEFSFRLLSVQKTFVALCKATSRTG